MAKPKTISVQIDRYDDLGRALSPDGELSDAALQQVVQLAVSGWMSCLLGPMRYRSMTELYLAWIGELYATVWSDRDPRERDLFSRLGLPYGQAVYLARVLREQQSPLLRKRTLTVLRDVLERRTKEISDIIKKDSAQANVEYSVTMTKNARRELNILMAEEIEKGTVLRPLRTEGTMDEYVSLLVRAKDVEPLAKMVRAKLDTM